MSCHWTLADVCSLYMRNKASERGIGRGITLLTTTILVITKWSKGVSHTLRRPAANNAKHSIGTQEYVKKIDRLGNESFGQSLESGESSDGREQNKIEENVFYQPSLC